MNWNEIEKIMEQTCFNSLAFCCGLNKSCPSRDKVLRELKITDENYKEFKKRCDSVLKFMLMDKTMETEFKTILKEQIEDKEKRQG